jgi:hypothetical protein
MEVEEIMYKLSQQETLYGYCASLYKDDYVFSRLFLKECYEEIKICPENAEKCFGLEVLEGIIDFCSIEP